MGRLEKIVVLTVLFLVAVVLGVALTPTGSANRGQKGGPIADLDNSEHPSDAGAKKNELEHLLNAEVDTSAKTAPTVVDPKAPVTPITNGANGANVAGANTAPTGATLAGTPAPNAPTAPNAPNGTGTSTEPKEKIAEPAKYILTLEGLKPSGAADMMFYSWKQGDTFAALAARFYGSKDKVTRLQKANEGRTEASMKLDELLWIPVAESAPAASSVESGKVYVVKAGDVLGGISQQFYGTTKKWQKILDANRDTLASPEKLKPGMRLRIPE